MCLSTSPVTHPVIESPRIAATLDARRADHAQDVKKLNPIHVVIAAVIGAAVFVVFLVVLVHFVIGLATSH